MFHSKNYSFQFPGTSHFEKSILIFKASKPFKADTVNSHFGKKPSLPKGFSLYASIVVFGLIKYPFNFRLPG